MPEASALITALILDRPLCLECISMRSPVTGAADALARLDVIGKNLHVRRERQGRCRACGIIGQVFSVERPPV